MKHGIGFALRMAALAVAVALVPRTASAEIYGWVDAAGEVTYSNLPPPKGARVIDVIHETPLSPKAVAEAAQASEISALNDRIRLLELEKERAQRVVVDYPAPPQGPPGVACGADGTIDCDAPWGPYYTTGLLLDRSQRSAHRHRYPPPTHGQPPHRAPPASPQPLRYATSRGASAESSLR